MIQKRMKLITQQMRRAGRKRAQMITVRRRVTGPERKMNRVNIDNYEAYQHTWPRGYKTFFMLNSTDHDISTAHEN